MSKLSELTVDQGLEKAFAILLDKGFKSNYYADWRAYANQNDDYDDEDFQTPDLEYSIIWEAFLEHVPRNQDFTDGEYSAKFVATEADGPAHDSETYFVVLSLSDGVETRYFKRDGWYASYDGGHLEDGNNAEVFPHEVKIVDFKESK
jgi:hypothetical protein